MKHKCFHEIPVSTNSCEWSFRILKGILCSYALCGYPTITPHIASAVVRGSWFSRIWPYFEGKEIDRGSTKPYGIKVSEPNHISDLPPSSSHTSLLDHVTLLLELDFDNCCASELWGNNLRGYYTQSLTTCKVAAWIDFLFSIKWLHFWPKLDLPHWSFIALWGYIFIIWQQNEDQIFQSLAAQFWLFRLEKTSDII